MVKCCSVYKCKSRPNDKAKEKKTSFFRFPVSRRKRDAWVKALQRKDWLPTAYSFVCSEHFEGGWHSDDPRDRNYVPTIFAYKTPHIPASAVGRKERLKQREDQKMVKCCSVYKCKSRPNDKAKEKKTSFFRFPVSRRKRDAWVKALQRKDWLPTAYSFVCSEHFEGGWHSDDPRDRNYVPTIFAYKTPHIPASAVGRKERLKQREDQKTAELVRMAETTTAARNIEFSLSCHDCYCTQEEPVSPPHEESNNYDDIDVRSVATKGTQCDADPLLVENRVQKQELFEQNEHLKQCQWNAEKIKGNDEKTRFYTGLPKYVVFMWLFSYLLPKARNMTYWTGSITAFTDRQRSTRGSLQLIDQLFAVLMRLKLGLFVQDIADRFQISVGTFSKIFTTWICLMYEELGAINIFPSRDIINRTMPASFKKYPNLRVIIDCTEIYVQKSSSLINQNMTFSNYKHHNTFKFLIGITPSGVISFVSEAWGDRASDRQITIDSGLLDLLEPGDSVMADKGFTISDLLKERYCTLNIPPFMGDHAQFTTQQVIQTQEIAELRIHVERSIGRIKNFHIFDGILHLSLAPLASKIFKVCSWLTNLDVPMVDS